MANFYSGNILFNSFDLTTITDVEFDAVKHESHPKKILQTGKLARLDGAKTFHSEYGEREILLEGHINGSGRSGFIAARDELIRRLQGLEKTLRLPFDGTQRDFTATLENVVFSEVGGGFATFSAKMVCADPFGYDTAIKTLVNASPITTATSTKSFLETVTGNYKSPPTITVRVVAVTGGTSKYIKITSLLGNFIKITRTWANNDSLVIDMKARTCRVNNADVEYTGKFFDLEIGDTSIDYEDSFTTRTSWLTVTYKRRYI